MPLLILVGAPAATTTPAGTTAMLPAMIGTLLLVAMTLVATAATMPAVETTEAVSTVARPGKYHDFLKLWPRLT